MNTNLYRSVKTAKVSELILEQLKSSILDGTMKPGDRVPSERELVEWFQASRVSVREALHRLEATGFISTRHGQGAFVAEMTSKPVSESLSSILKIQKATINDLTAARLIFEPNIAELACEKITPEGLLKLEENIQATERTLKTDPAIALEHNFRFHSLLAEITGNPVLTLIMKAISDVCKEWMSQFGGEDLQKRSLVDANAILEHKNILKAISERNRKKANKEMLKHIRQVQRDWMRIKWNVEK